MCRKIVIAFVMYIIATPSSASYGGLYHRDTIGAYEIDEYGFARVPDIDLFLTMVNIVKKVDNLESDDAVPLVRSIQERAKKGANNQTPAEQLALATDEIRLRTASRVHSTAMDILIGLRGHPPEGQEFIVLSHLAHAHLLRKDNPNAYQDAHTQEESALTDYDFPMKLLGLSPTQLSWYRRLEKDYYLPFLRHRSVLTNKNRGKLPDKVDPLFPKGIARAG